VASLPFDVINLILMALLLIFCMCQKQNDPINHLTDDRHEEITLVNNTMATTIWAKSKLIKNKIVPFYKN
jgi:hypothetical protein